MISRTSLHIKAVASVLVAAIKLSVITIDIEDLVSVRKTVEGAEPIDIDPVCQWTLTQKPISSSSTLDEQPLSTQTGVKNGRIQSSSPVLFASGAQFGLSARVRDAF